MGNWTTDPPTEPGWYWVRSKTIHSWKGLYHFPKAGEKACLEEYSEQFRWDTITSHSERHIDRVIEPGDN